MVEVVSWLYLIIIVIFIYYNIKIIKLKVKIYDLNYLMKKNQQLAKKHICDKYKFKECFKRSMKLLKNKF
jgi:hypothetical protein